MTLSLVLAGPFHQHHAVAGTIYLIRVNEFRGKERLQNTDDRQRGIKEGKAFIIVSSWISLVQCKHKRATWAMTENVAFLLPK